MISHTPEQESPCRQCGHKFLEHDVYQRDENLKGDGHCFFKPQCGCNQFVE